MLIQLTVQFQGSNTKKFDVQFALSSLMANSSGTVKAMGTSSPCAKQYCS